MRVKYKMNTIIKKFDIHCHVLPWLDDGSSSVPETLKMVQMAASQGFDGLIVTPHHSHHFQRATPELTRSYCRKLETAIQARIKKDFRLYPGQEIMYYDGALEDLENGRVLTLAGSRYVLLEFMPEINYSYLFTAVRRMTAANYLPVLAHVERYEALRAEGRLEELISIGAYAQMNYRSIGGRWYNDTARWCREMLESGNIHFLGTDMHNAGHRAPDTEKAEKWMRKNLNGKYIKQLCFSNAQCILENIRI